MCLVCFQNEATLPEDMPRFCTTCGLVCYSCEEPITTGEYESCGTCYRIYHTKEESVVKVLTEMIPDMDKEQLALFEKMKDMIDSELDDAIYKMEELGLEFRDEIPTCAPQMPEECHGY